jgi:2-polyprenyl-3-methyl-5-hydroxy-6-metoxy-1,4-benzoquinol methylase
MEPLGLELSEQALNRARALHEGCQAIAHSVEDRPWPVPAGTFDVVVAFEVIEHLMRPLQLLAGAHEALRPGGYLALTTPYHGLLKNIALSVKGFDRHFAVQGPHIRFFSDTALRQLLCQAGFRVGAVRHFGRLPTLWAGVFVWAQKVGEPG